MENSNLPSHSNFTPEERKILLSFLENSLNEEPPNRLAKYLLEASHSSSTKAQFSNVQFYTLQRKTQEAFDFMQRNNLKELDALKKQIDEISSSSGQDFESTEREILEERELIEMRNELEGQLGNALTQLMLYVKDPNSIRNVLAVSTNFLFRINKAQSEGELNFIKNDIKLIENVIDRDKQDQKRKKDKRLTTQRWLILVMILIGFGIVLSIIFIPNEVSTIDASSLIPIINVPLGVIIWGALGSFAAILYRFNRSNEAEIDNVTRWLLTRPVTGILMATISYFILRTGILLLSSEGTVINSNDMLWLLAFLIGFSDRFANRVMSILVGKFGGDENSELVTDSLLTDDDQAHFIAAYLGAFESQDEEDVTENDEESNEAKQEMSKNSHPVESDNQH